MKLLDISNDPRKVMVDDEDHEILSAHRWYLHKAGAGGYVKTSSAAKISLHRMVIGAEKGAIVDHVNGNTLDNRKENLRLCSHAENMCNRKKRKDSKNRYKGVYRRVDSGLIRYQAIVTFGGKYVWSAYFKSEYAAALAYDLSARKWHGKFARCNILIG